MLNIVLVILVNTPTINAIPPMVSASAIGICSSGGKPNPIRCSHQIGSNFFKPYAMNMTPTDARIPQQVISCSLFVFVIFSLKLVLIDLIQNITY